MFLDGLVAQAVRRSPPTAGVPSSRLGPSMWVSWWTKRGLGRFPLPQISFHHFSTLISRTYNVGASSHLIPRPDLMLDTS